MKLMKFVMGLGLLAEVGVSCVASAVPRTHKLQPPQTLACNLNQAVHMAESRFANLKIEGQVVSLETFKGDNWEMFGVRRESGPVTAQVLAAPDSPTLVYVNEEKGLELNIVPMVDPEGRIGAAQVSGKFRDLKTSKAVSFYGSFSCH
jgi:hypothetical protein